MATIAWEHSGIDVFWLVVELESPRTFWIADRDKRVWSATGLQPTTPTVSEYGDMGPDISLAGLGIDPLKSEFASGTSRFKRANGDVAGER